MIREPGVDFKIHVHRPSTTLPTVTRQKMPLKLIDQNPLVFGKEPEFTSQHELIERHANGDDWRLFKSQIGPALRASGDDPPRLVVAGNGHPLKVCSNVRLKMKPGDVVTRGYKIYLCERPDKFARDNRLVWKAVPHLVVKTDTGAYKCFTVDIKGSKFLFLPSSRMSAELTAAELLTGNYMLSSVVGGDIPELTTQLCQSFHFMFATPEEAKPRRNVHALIPKDLQRWLSTHRPNYDVSEVARAVGLPVRDPDDKTDEWQDNGMLAHFVKILGEDIGPSTKQIDALIEDWVTSAEKDGRLAYTTPLLSSGLQKTGLIAFEPEPIPDQFAPKYSAQRVTYIP